MSNTKLIVGLGNPEERFNVTRHNIGFIAVDALLDHYKAKDGILRFSDSVIDVPYSIVNKDVVLFLKPMDWMNFSGKSVGRVVNKLKIDPQNVMVIHDDVDFCFGEHRVKASGSSGGHNGVDSVIKNIGKNFARFRIGVGRPDIIDNPMSVRDYVLSDFSVYEQKDLAKIQRLAIEVVDSFIVHGVQKTMNMFNRKC